MPIYVEGVGSRALYERCKAIQEAAQTNSRPAFGMRLDMQRIAEADNEDKLFRGVDRYGRPRAPLAPATLKNKRRGPNPLSLVPHGFASRFIQNFEAVWETVNGIQMLICRYRDILSKKGRPFAQYHFAGTSRMPRRDIAGITPKGWRQIRERFAQFRDDVRRANATTGA